MTAALELEPIACPLCGVARATELCEQFTAEATRSDNLLATAMRWVNVVN